MILTKEYTSKPRHVKMMTMLYFSLHIGLISFILFYRLIRQFRFAEELYALCLRSLSFDIQLLVKQMPVIRFST
jgi:hypothetical protein